MTTRRSFLASALGALAAGSVRAEEAAAPGAALPASQSIPSGPSAVQPTQSGGIRVRFLGSGAAGWKPEWLATKPHMRRQSSVLLDGKVLIDYTFSAKDMLPEGCRPEVLFQTHSHGDHYDPAATVRLGVKRMYVNETWAEAARRGVASASERLSLPAPKVIALPFGKPVEEEGLTFTGVPANHSTSRVTDGVLERTSLYLVEKGDTRLLYATDTGGIPGDAARMIGIDPHINKSNYKHYGEFVVEPKPLTAFIMEATNGDIDDDFRIFVHSSVQAVARIATMLQKNGRLALPEGQNVWLTHLGIKYRSWPAEKVDAELPAPLRAAYDGLEVTLG